ncbi:MAG: hypothetical protein QXW69_08040 [Nitrososphaerota archaeon]
MDDALSFIRDMEYDDFVKEKKTIYAILRAIEVIGEAEKRYQKQ